MTGRPDPEADPRRAWQELFSGKGLDAILRATAAWHDCAPVINQVVREVAGYAAATWPRPFPDFTAGNGLRIVPLLSLAELAEEGSAMRHCIGSYGPQAASGRSVIVSVRDPDGRRLSTAEIRGARGAEHKGPSNAAPGPREVAAIEELSRTLSVTPRRAPGGAMPARLSGMWRQLVRKALDLASPDHRPHPYNPLDAARVMRVAFAWGDQAPRAARGSVGAIVARQMPGAAEALAALASAGLTYPKQLRGARAARRVLIALMPRPITVFFICMTAFASFMTYSIIAVDIRNRENSYYSIKAKRDSIDKSIMKSLSAIDQAAKPVVEVQGQGGQAAGEAASTGAR